MVQREGVAGVREARNEVRIDSGDLEKRPDEVDIVGGKQSHAAQW
jgi:hypothetical protein